MMNRRGVPLTIACVCATLFGFAAGSAHDERARIVQANHSSGWFRAATYKWTIDPPIQVGLLESELSAFPSELNDTLARVSTAAQTWAAVPYSTWDPFYQGFNSSYIWTGSFCTTGLASAITMVSDDDSFIAGTNPAVCSGLLRYTIRFDITPTWYNGSSASIPVNQRDFWSAAVHELGHAGAFGPTHFSDAAACPGTSNANQSTMCSGSSGFPFWRSLTTHDSTVFGFEY